MHLVCRFLVGPFPSQPAQKQRQSGSKYCPPVRLITSMTYEYAGDTRPARAPIIDPEYEYPYEYEFPPVPLFVYSYLTTYEGGFPVSQFSNASLQLFHSTRTRQFLTVAKTDQRDESASLFYSWKLPFPNLCSTERSVQGDLREGFPMRSLTRREKHVSCRISISHPTTLR